MSSQGGIAAGRGVRVVAGGGRDDRGELFQLQEDELLALLAPVADRPVALLSVAGAFRGGKSFLLNYCLRYLYAEAGARADGSWLGAADDSLRGFSWRGGSTRDTTGLQLWSQPFLVTLPSGEEVALLVMDTQGAFDEHSSLRDSSQLFALSTLLASVQVYNLTRNIDETDLQHLQVFTEYAAAGGGRGALPALQLLVRDWRWPAEFPYGAAGGDAYVRHKLQEQPRELRSVRRRLAASFAELRCFLLPHPGLRADADPAFTGRVADLTEEFKLSLRELVPRLLAPENLRVKTVEGRPLLARDLAPLLRAYLHAFRDRVPEPRDILAATATASWLAAAGEARAAVAAALPRATLCRGALRAHLGAARDAARAPLEPLATRAGDPEGLANLTREIDSQLARYTEINEQRLEAAVAGAQLEWERVAPRVQGALCRHARRHERAAARARDAARAHYERLVPAAAAHDDPHRAGLLQWIQERYDEVIDMNKRKNLGAADKAYWAFKDAMREGDSTLQLYAADLDAQLAAAEKPAIDVLRERRLSSTDFGVDDIFYDGLVKRMRDMHDFYHKQNIKKTTKTDIGGVAAQIGLLGVATVATGPVGAAASAGAIAALVGNIYNAYQKPT